MIKSTQNKDVSTGNVKFRKYSRSSEGGNSQEEFVPDMWDAVTIGTGWALTNSDLTGTKSSGGWTAVRSEVGKTGSGKYYMEITVDTMPAINTNVMLGVGTSAISIDTYIGSSADGHCYQGNGAAYGSNAPASWGTAYTTSDVIGIAVDLDNEAIYFSKNGTWQNSSDPESGASRTGAHNSKHYLDNTKTYYIGISVNSTSGAFTANFGGSAFSYAVPAGYTSGWGV